MKGVQIDFASAGTAARFNTLRDDWRAVALGGGTGIKKDRAAALRIAGILPTFLSREFGYCFPTNEDLAKALNMSLETVKRGVKALVKAGLIESQLIPKRNEAGRMIGKLRRIYLTLPEAAEQVAPKGQDTEGSTPSPKGQKQPTEGSYGGAYILDKNTPDKDSTVIPIKVSSYAHARENVPSAYRNDTDFLDAFDRIVIDMTDGKEIGAGELDRIVQTAFDQTTDSNRDLFMPFHWRDMCRLRHTETANWFRQRTGHLIHRKAA